MSMYHEDLNAFDIAFAICLAIVGVAFFAHLWYYYV